MLYSTVINGLSPSFFCCFLRLPHSHWQICLKHAECVHDIDVAMFKVYDHILCYIYGCGGGGGALDFLQIKHDIIPAERGIRFERAFCKAYR